MAIPVEITGIVVLSVVIFVCAVIALVSNDDYRMKIMSICRHVVYGRLFKRFDEINS